MVFEFYTANTLRQCDLASRQFLQVCCATPMNPVCDQGEWPDNVYPWAGFRFTRANAALSPADVTTELVNGRPVEVYYAWRGGGAHVALITGIFDNGDVWVNDPWPSYGAGRRAFNFVINAYNLGAWSISYSQIEPIPATTGTV